MTKTSATPVGGVRTSWKNQLVDPAVVEVMDGVLECAFRVHRTLGPGLLESVYRRCLAHALQKAGMQVETEVWLPLVFEDMTLEKALRVDLFVEGTLVVEVKAIEQLTRVHRAQLRTYLLATGAPAGLLLNFDVEFLRTGFDRLVHPRFLQ